MSDENRGITEAELIHGYGVGLVGKRFASALLAVQQELPKLQKDAINPHFKNKYISLDSLMAAIRPVLSKHGLVWITQPCRDERGEPALSYRLIHAESGESEGGVMPLMMAKSDPQGQGSAITYARRYSITAMLGLVADEDDDGHRATQGRQAANGHAPSDVSPLVTSEDVETFYAAAKGLTGRQIRLTLTSCGLDAPEKVDDGFRAVPQVKAKLLGEALAGVERESVPS